MSLEQLFCYKCYNFTIKQNLSHVIFRKFINRFRESPEDFRWNKQDREISLKKKMWRSLFFDKFEGFQPADLMKLDLFKGTLQGFCPQLQLTTLKKSYF